MIVSGIGRMLLLVARVLVLLVRRSTAAILAVIGVVAILLAALLLWLTPVWLIVVPLYWHPWNASPIHQFAGAAMLAAGIGLLLRIVAERSPFDLYFDKVKMVIGGMPEGPCRQVLYPIAGYLWQEAGVRRRAEVETLLRRHGIEFRPDKAAPVVRGYVDFVGSLWGQKRSRSGPPRGSGRP